MREGTTSRVKAADRPYGKFYDFYSVSSENFGSTLVSDNEIYLLIKYIKRVLWRVAKCLSYIEEARCPKFNPM